MFTTFGQLGIEQCLRARNTCIQVVHTVLAVLFCPAFHATLALSSILDRLRAATRALSRHLWPGSWLMYGIPLPHVQTQNVNARADTAIAPSIVVIRRTKS
jgi:hypothetical protein